MTNHSNQDTQKILKLYALHSHNKNKKKQLLSCQSQTSMLNKRDEVKFFEYTGGEKAKLGVRKNGHNLHKYFNERLNLESEDKEQVDKI